MRELGTRKKSLPREQIMIDKHLEKYKTIYLSKFLSQVYQM